MAKLTLQQILQRHLDDYYLGHRLDLHRLAVCRHLQQCHTPAMGGLEYQCDQCQQTFQQYHGCRDRHCPQCQYCATRQWRDRQQQDILPVPYYHLVFTLPHELNGWIQLHPEVFYQLLFQSVWQTLKVFAEDPKRLHGQLGMTAVLHTWGQSLDQHVHLHCLLPAGALDEKKQWQPAKSDYLYPIKALSRVYRGKMVSALRTGYEESKLPRITRAGEVDRILDQLMRKDWAVYSKPCLNHSEQVVGYLARYTHRIAISDQRLIALKRDQVEFAVKDYRTQRHTTMTLQCTEFIRRFLLHIVPKGLMRIRHYGFLSNRLRKTSIKLIRNLLQQPKPTEDSDDEAETENHMTLCPHCGIGHLICIGEIPPESLQMNPQPG